MAFGGQIRDRLAEQNEVVRVPERETSPSAHDQQNFAIAIPATPWGG